MVLISGRSPGSTAAASASETIFCRLYEPEVLFPDHHGEPAPAVAEQPPPLEPAAEKRLADPAVIAPLPEPDAPTPDPRFVLPAPTPDAAAAREAYTRRLWELIFQCRRYPAALAGSEMKGEVIVIFTLRRNGELAEAVIPRGGGSAVPEFNREALRAVREAGDNFPPFPPEIKEKELCFQLPIVFSLSSEDPR